jgi:uncharacterized membrane protein (Fun14 family)
MNFLGMVIKISIGIYALLVLTMAQKGVLCLEKSGTHMGVS